MCFAEHFERKYLGYLQFVTVTVLEDKRAFFMLLESESLDIYWKEKWLLKET